MHYIIYDVIYLLNSHQNVSTLIGSSSGWRYYYKNTLVQMSVPTFNTSLTLWIKTRHITASSITPQKVNNF